MALSPWRWALVAGLALVGCRPPPLQRLTDKRAFDQAICAASEHSRHPERALAFVRDRIDAEARPRLHLHAVPRSELVRTLGPAGALLADHAVVVRAVAAIDDVQIDDFQLRVVLIGPEGPVEPIPPHVERIADFTGETIPPAQVEVIESRRRAVPRRFNERPLLGMGAAILEAATLFVVPVTEVTGHSERIPGRTIVTEPTDAEVFEAAPAASTLADAIAGRTYVTSQGGQEVASAWLWPRTDGVDLRIGVEWSYAAYGCAGPRPVMRRTELHTRIVSRYAELLLPTGPDLESRIASVFGPQMRMLASGR